jgi:S-ribosylhomocysteine lyase LuxS involved in autoinducer biosynthesis
MDTHNKIHIVNHTQDFVDTIRFKPCGAPTKLYTTLTGSIKPEEKVMLNVYELCIDVVAEDAFQQTVYEQNNVKVTHSVTLDIK